MTADEIREMAEKLPRGNNVTVRQVVSVMTTLRAMDVEVIDRILDLHQMALQYMPDELKPAFEGMIMDMILIKIFIEQAKTYNKVEEGEKAFEAIFGKIEEGGDK